MGFHAERVSEGEQRMLDSLAEALAPPSTSSKRRAAASTYCAGPGSGRRMRRRLARS